MWFLSKFNSVLDKINPYSKYCSPVNQTGKLGPRELQLNRMHITHKEHKLIEYAPLLWVQPTSWDDTTYRNSDILHVSLSGGISATISIVLVFFWDALLSDDEPLWEPIDWSLVQTGLLFIFIFGWIAENLIFTRYGSYVGRDKRVWLGWYKTFWLLEIYYMFSFLVVASFIIVPFYFEINYSAFFIYSWWHWFSRIFFHRFIFILSIVIFMGHLLQKYLQWWHWKQLFTLVIVINCFLSYLLYTHFIVAFFGYTTDKIWQQKFWPVDYVQLSNGPAKWGYSIAKRDHFTFHNTKTVFWFKNDGPLASAILFFHLFTFISFFFVYLYWVSLLRRIYATREVPTTYTTYCVSALKQLFYCFLMLYFFIGLSFVFQYWRLPVELTTQHNVTSWLTAWL